MRLTVMDETIVLNPKFPLVLDTLQGEETARLEEILDMLVKHGLDPTENSHVHCSAQTEDEITNKNSSFIDRAFFKQDDYTGACFRAACDSEKKRRNFRS